MRHRPNPYRVLAHAVDVGDRELATALRRRLSAGEPPRPAVDTVDKLLRLLGMCGPRG